MRATRGTLLAARLAQLLTLGFLALWSAAAARYPGGTHYAPGARGHDFWRTFLCDLLRDPALNGQPNPATGFALAAMLVLIAAIVLTLATQPRLFEVHAPRLARFARYSAGVAALGMLGVPLLPSDRFPGWHGVVVLAAVIPTLGCALLGVLGISRISVGGRGLALLGWTTLALVVVDAALYARETFWSGSLLVATPALQRVASGLVLIWVLWVNQLLARSARVTPAVAD